MTRARTARPGKRPSWSTTRCWLVSELVTNAVVHAGTSVQVTCKLAASGVEVVVRDSHPAKMVPGPAGRSAAGRAHQRTRAASALGAGLGVGVRAYGARSKAVWFRMAPIGQNADGTGPGELIRSRPRQRCPRCPGSALVDAQCPARDRPPRRASYHRAGHHGTAGNGNESAAEPGYDELLCQSVAQARVVVAADAAYALVADEDGDLSVRAATGISPAALLRTAPSVSTVPFLTDGRVSRRSVRSGRRDGPAGSAKPTYSACRNSPTGWPRRWNGPGWLGSNVPGRPGSACSPKPATCWLARFRRTGSWAWRSGSPCPGWPPGRRCCWPARAAGCALSRCGTPMTPSGPRWPGWWTRSARRRPRHRVPGRTTPGWTANLPGAGRWPRCRWPGRPPVLLSWRRTVAGASPWSPRRPCSGCSSSAGPALPGRPGKWPGWPGTWRAGSRWRWRTPGSARTNAAPPRLCAPPWYRRNCPGFPGWSWLSRTTCRGRPTPWAVISATCSRSAEAGGGSPWARSAGAALLPWRWPRWPAARCGSWPRRATASLRCWTG